jgi:hypothetical protein
MNSIQYNNFDLIFVSLELIFYYHIIVSSTVANFEKINRSFSFLVIVPSVMFPALNDRAGKRSSTSAMPFPCSTYIQSLCCMMLAYHFSV